MGKIRELLQILKSVESPVEGPEKEVMLGVLLKSLIDAASEELDLDEVESLKEIKEGGKDLLDLLLSEWLNES